MVFTYKNRFNKKYGFAKDEPHSLADISKITGFKKSGLDTIFSKGVGAFKTNRSAVRAGIRSPEQWSYGRLYSAVMGGAAAKVDAKHLIRK